MAGLTDFAGDQYHLASLKVLGGVFPWKMGHTILVHLEGTGRDQPALEPSYRHSCYIELTIFLSKPQKDLPEESLHYGKP